jgi:hypothetical protein
MEEESRIHVVLHFRDGRTVRGTLAQDFSPRTDAVEALDGEGEPVHAGVEELKAVFFVKDPRQRGADLQLNAQEAILRDSAIARVEFFDGEVIKGRVQSFSFADRGFYLYPSSVDSNNERIFVVASALTTLTIEG